MVFSLLPGLSTCFPATMPLSASLTMRLMAFSVAASNPSTSAAYEIGCPEAALTVDLPWRADLEAALGARRFSCSLVVAITFQ